VDLHQVLRELFLRGELAPAYMAPSDLAVAPLLVHFAHPGPFSLDVMGIPTGGCAKPQWAPTLAGHRSWVLIVENSRRYDSGR